MTARPPTPTVTVVRTSTANLASVRTGFERLGCSVRLTSDADDVARADRVVLPGVGAFAAARQAISANGLSDALRQRLVQGRPTLGICLGMQLMTEGSDEAPGVPGLGVVGGTVSAYRTDRTGGWRVPQMGWNRVEPDEGCALIGRGHAYFANSYRLADAPDGWLAGRSEYAGSFVAAFERGAVLGCQFHPELSGDYGRGLLVRWLAA